MSRVIRIGVVVVVVGLACLGLWPDRSSMPGAELSGPATSLPKSIAASAQTGAAARERYAQSLMAFEPNLGQTDPAVRYFARGAGYTLFLTPTEAVLSLRAMGMMPKRIVSPRTPSAIPISPGPTAVVRLSLVGANPAPTLSGQDQQPGVSNYFLGKDPAKWRRDVPHYGRVQYDDVYPGVGLVYYGNQQRLEYDFLVAPGADPAQIAMNYRGVDELKLDDQGNLVLGAGVGELVQHRPVAYQEIAGELRAIEADYTLFADHRVGIQLGEYDHGKPLVIDPVLAYGTYLGGTGFDFSTLVAVDSVGNMYVSGTTMSTDFPRRGAYQNDYGGGSYDAYVSKINAAGSLLVYSTYLGGTDSDESYGLAVDSAGNAYVSGQTASGNFPITAGALQTVNGTGGNPPNPPTPGWDAFVTKLNAAGNDLVYSTYLGGQGAEWDSALALDSSGNAYIAGTTTSSDFPVVTPIQASISSDSWDAYVAKLNSSGTALVNSTYLGGSGIDVAYGVAVDAKGEASVAGETGSADFAAIQGVYHANAYHGGGRDGFVTKVNASGKSLNYVAFLGGSGDDYATSIASNSAGELAIGGYTASTDLDTGGQKTYGGGANDALVCEFNASTSFVCTYLGGTGDDRAYGVAMDRAGNKFVAGYTTESSTFPLSAALYTPSVGALEIFLTKFRFVNGPLIAYSTLLGNGGGNYEGKVAVDKWGAAYVGNATNGGFRTAVPLYGSCSGSSCGDATLTKVAESSAQPWAGDFDGDGKDDILWRNLTTGANVIWKSANSATQQTVAAVTDTNWIVAGIGDFDGDTKADVFWRNVETGANMIWKSANSATQVTRASVTDFNWQVAGVGDFDGDGKADVLWHNLVARGNVIWRSADNTTTQSMTSVSTVAWGVVGVGDFNGDGKADVLWRHNTTGANVIWRSANSATAQVVNGVTDGAWRVLGVADVNGDLKADIIWRNANTGADTVWLSASNVTTQSMASMANAWRILGVGDYTGDGQADILWRNTATGGNIIWKSAKSATTQATTGVTNLDWWPQS